MKQFSKDPCVSVPFGRGGSWRMFPKNWAADVRVFIPSQGLHQFSRDVSWELCPLFDVYPKESFEFRRTAYSYQFGKACYGTMFVGTN